MPTNDSLERKIQQAVAKHHAAMKKEIDGLVSREASKKIGTDIYTSIGSEISTQTTAVTSKPAKKASKKK